MTPTRRETLRFAAAGGAFALSGGARAQSFPSRTVTIVVPYPPGGPTDSLARILAQELGTAFGQTVIVDNRSGGSGVIGARAVARAEPDGHTVVLTANQTHATNPSLLKDVGYDPVKDFTPIAGLADLQHVLVVKKDLGVASVGELIALMRAKPGAMNYGSTGVASGSHLAMELFKTITKVEAQHVPFRGAAPLVQELLGGRIDLAFCTLPSVLGQVKSGDVKGLALASAIRAPQLPEMPLLKEQGVVGGEADAWLAVFGPAGVSGEVVERWWKGIEGALGKAGVQELVVKQGIALNLRDPGALGRFVEAEIGRWGEVIRAGNVKVEPE